MVLGRLVGTLRRNLDFFAAALRDLCPACRGLHVLQLHLLQLDDESLKELYLVRDGLGRQVVKIRANLLLQLHHFDLFKLGGFLQLVKLLVVLLEQVE